MPISPTVHVTNDSLTYLVSAGSPRNNSCLIECYISKQLLRFNPIIHYISIVIHHHSVTDTSRLSIKTKSWWNGTESVRRGAETMGQTARVEKYPPNRARRYDDRTDSSRDDIMIDYTLNRANNTKTLTCVIISLAASISLRDVMSLQEPASLSTEIAAQWSGDSHV